ncbi:MAG: VWA domain-containing protein [Ferrovibrionaceae bacterium]
MSGDLDKRPQATGDVADFLARVAAAPRPQAGGARGRLIFALDATASRQPSWDRASALQNQRCAAAAAIGGLEAQLVYFRGFDECRAAPFTADAARMIGYMGRIHCEGGQTQIGRVLSHALATTRDRRVNALVYVGDACEEAAAGLIAQAGELGLLGLPAFMFHEGGEPAAAATFRQIARLSGGAYFPFDAGSASVLRDLLAAVAVFAAGGRPALADMAKKQGGAAPLLLAQMK